MDKIILRNIQFMGYHGCEPEEALSPQPFVIDLDIETNLERAAHSDDIKDTVSYAEIMLLVKDIVMNKKFQLLEKLGSTICQDILNSYPKTQAVHIRLTKPQAPIKESFDAVGIEMTRTR